MPLRSSTRFTRSVLGLGLSMLAACSGCQADSAEDFASLQPLFFPAINTFDEQAQQALPVFEQRMERMADSLMQRTTGGELTDPTERAEAGRALFYAAFTLHVGQHGMEDGYTDATKLLEPHRYAPGGDDRAELLGRMQRSGQILTQAATLRPTDSQILALQRSVAFNQEALSGGPTPATLTSMLTAAATDRFSLFAALILLRDPELYPMSAPYMEQLYSIVCSPQGFDCDHPPAPADPNEPRWLTTKVAGPVLLSDFLVRRVELLFARADANPPMAAASLAEASGRLRVAAGALQGATANSESADLSIYPAHDTLSARKQRIDILQAGLTARQAGMVPPGLPESTQYYKSREYRAAYQCSACHVPRMELPPSFGGIPK